MDLRGRLSNPQALENVGLAAQALAAIKPDAGQTSSPPPAPRRWRIVGRLGEQTIRDLLRDNRSGMTMRALAQRYGISVSSGKRLRKR